MKMKFSIKTVSAALMCSALLFTACTDLTDGFSTDPVNITDPTVITTDKFLSGTLVSLIGVYEGDMNRLTGMWVGYYSGEDRQYIGLSNYGVSGRDFNTEWGGLYASVIKNAHIIKSRAREEKNPRMLAIAQATEAMAAGLAADLWGDVPFTEMGRYPEIASPKYDAQASVYANVQVLLDSAIDNFAITVPAKPLKDAADADFFFSADPTAWTQVCNTLKARFYLHTRDYTNALTYANIGIDTASNDMLAPHGTSYLQNFNLFYSFTNYDRPGYMAGNAYAPALMDPDNADSRNNDKTNENSRFNYYYLPNFDGTYDVNYLNEYDYGTPKDYDGFMGAETSFPMVTYAENQLIRAEATIKGGGSLNDALTILNEYREYLNGGGYWTPGYQDNPTAMLLDDPTDPGFYLPYDASDFDAGEIENADGIDPTAALLREILEERYVTLYGQLETYNDIRRTGNLIGVPVKSGNATIPLRLLYPQSEINTNTNVPTSGVDLFQSTPVNSTAY